MHAEAARSSCKMLLSFLCFCVVAVAFSNEQRPKLVFNSHGEFKIGVFADLHYGEGENVDWGPYQDGNSTIVMKKMLVMESPDFVMYSGDQLTGENIHSNATLYWAKVVEPCAMTGTRWAVVFGNHDDKSASGGTRQELLAFDMKYNLSYSQAGPPNLHGLTNYYLLIYSKESDHTPSWVVYVLDSGGGTIPELVYGDQIQWLVNTSTELTSKYGPVPAIAFFHIPSTEYQDQYAHSLCNGTNNDTVAPQIKPNKLVSTLFSHANVRMTIVGHNHGNDWCCPYQGKDLDHMICFARHTGYGGYGSWMRGSRMVVLHTQGRYQTYVRMEDGRIL